MSRTENISTIQECPNDDEAGPVCDGTIDITGTITHDSQPSNFWGQTVHEDISEIEVTGCRCDTCGYELDDEEAADLLDRAL